MLKMIGHTYGHTRAPVRARSHACRAGVDCQMPKRITSVQAQSTDKLGLMSLGYPELLNTLAGLLSYGRNPQPETRTP